MPRISEITERENARQSMRAAKHAAVVSEANAKTHVTARMRVARARIANARVEEAKNKRVRLPPRSLTPMDPHHTAWRTNAMIEEIKRPRRRNASLDNKLAEIERNARRRDRRDARSHSGPPPGVIVGEVRKVLRDFYGTLPNERESIGTFAILLHCIAGAGGGMKHMTAAKKEFAPWMKDAPFLRLAKEAIENPKRWKADKLAQRLGVTKENRKRLGLRTIGAMGQTAEERMVERKAKKAETARLKRRAAGAVPRDEYEANSLSRKQPWLEFGCSRRTWERKGKPMPVTQVRTQYKEKIPTGHGLAAKKSSHAKERNRAQGKPSNVICLAEYRGRRQQVTTRVVETPHGRYLVITTASGQEFAYELNRHLVNTLKKIARGRS
jgi:hypothetical protein